MVKTLFASKINQKYLFIRMMYKNELEHRVLQYDCHTLEKVNV